MAERDAETAERVEGSRSGLNVAPGSVVVVRDEEWLVTATEHTRDGVLVTVQGLSELVRETTAMFYERYDDIEVYDPAEASIEPDPSPGYRRDQAQAYGQLAVDIAAGLERHVEFPDVQIPRIPVDVDDIEDDGPERAAGLVRERWELGAGPAS